MDSIVDRRGSLCLERVETSRYVPGAAMNRASLSQPSVQPSRPQLPPPRPFPVPVLRSRLSIIKLHRYTEAYAVCVRQKRSSGKALRSVVRGKMVVCGEVASCHQSEMKPALHLSSSSGKRKALRGVYRGVMHDGVRRVAVSCARRAEPQDPPCPQTPCPPTYSHWPSMCNSRDI